MWLNDIAKLYLYKPTGNVWVLVKSDPAPAASDS